MVYKTTDDIIRQIKDGTLREGAYAGGGYLRQPSSSLCSKRALQLASTPTSVVVP